MKTIRLLLTLFLSIVLFACDQVTTATTAATTVSTATTQAPVTTTQTTTIANEAPSIAGAADKTVNRTAAFNPLSGITATDPEDGDLTASIVVDSDVDTSVAGTYTVTLSVTDSGDRTVSVSYVVTVVVSANETKALADLATINFVPGTALPSFGSNGSLFYWTSTNPRVLTNRGLVIPPPVGSDPVVVTMNLRIVNGSFSMTTSFEATIQPSPEVAVTSSVMLPFEGTSTEYVVANQAAVPVYYVNNGTVPYIDVATFINMVDGALDSEIIDVTPVGDDVLVVSYTVEYEDFDGSIVQDTYTATIDFTENTFTVSSFDFFEGYVASTESDYGEGLNYVDADYTDGAEVTIPLGYYNFDIIVHEDGGSTYYLMPLAVTDLLFLGGVYYDVYYNGDKLWGVDTFGLSGGTEEDEAIHEAMRTSSLNSATMAKDMKWASFNYLALAIDYFYGLKEDKGIETYYDILLNYVDLFINRDDLTLYNKIFDLANALDDLHSWHEYGGYYEPTINTNPSLSVSNLGPQSYAFYEGLWAIQDQLDAKYGSYENLPEFELLDGDKIAVIHLTGFTIDTPDAFKTILDGLPASVESVVIDLSYNTGGNIGAVFRIFGYMTESPFMYHSKNPADGATVTYYIESDYVAYDYEWYILTSSVTFSAANLMTSMAKEQGIATIIGQPSSGGASSIGVIVTPDGSILFISTNNVLCTRVGDEVNGYQYLSIEDGIEPEYDMVNVTSDAELIALIHSIQSGN